MRRNKEIRLSPLRVIDQDNKQVGVIERDVALRMAREAGLDLVEVQANVRPPLCKIMDFGKYKYEQSKKKNAKNKASKTTEVKEVRLGRSVKIDSHDVALRVNQARKFLLEGHRVIVVQRFRGREMAHPQIGEDRLKDIAEKLSDIALLQSPPKMNGRQMTMTLSPDKSKITAIRAKEEKAERAAAAAAAAEAGDAEVAATGAEAGDAEAAVTAEQAAPAAVEAVEEQKAPEEQQSPEA